MRRDRSCIRATKAAWTAAADLAGREPYRSRAYRPFRRVAAFTDLVPEFVWAARQGGLWLDATGSMVVAYTTQQQRWRTWWLAWFAFGVTLAVVLGFAVVASLSGVNHWIVLAGMLALLWAGSGGRPIRTWSMSSNGKALRRHRQTLGPHTYVSFIYKPKGRPARSPFEIAATLQQQGELAGPYVAQAASAGHVRLYRRYGFDVIEDVVIEDPSRVSPGRSTLMMLSGDLPGTGR